MSTMNKKQIFETLLLLISLSNGSNCHVTSSWRKKAGYVSLLSKSLLIYLLKSFFAFSPNILSIFIGEIPEPGLKQKII